MEKEIKKEKTVFDLKLHETLVFYEELGSVGKEAPIMKKYEVTRVPGGWIYSFEYPGWRQNQNVFIPLAEHINNK